MGGQADCQREDGLTVEYTCDLPGGLFDRLGRYVEVRDGATAAGTDGVEQQAVRFECRNEFLCRPLRIDHVEEQNVGIDGVRIDRNPGNLLQPRCELSRMGMIVREPLNIVLQCIKSCCRQDSGLAHRPSIHSAEPTDSLQPQAIVGCNQ